MTLKNRAGHEEGRVRIGIIGAGYWGPNLARNFADMDSARLVVVADLDPSALGRLQARYPGLRTTTDYTELFEMDLDAVVIATPPATHHDIAQDCLRHGLHCLIEKPITRRTAEAEELIQLARSRDLRLMVGHTFEYNPAVREVRRIVDAGELGEIFYIDAVRTNLGLFQLEADAMWDLAPHDISIINYVLDAQPVRVSAHGSSFVLKDIGVNDLVYLHMEYPEGRMASIRVSWLDPNKTRRTTVVGDRRMLVYDDVQSLEKIRVYDKGVEAGRNSENYKQLQARYRYGDVTIPHISEAEPLRLECEHFVTCVRTGATPQSDGTSGLHVVQALAAAEIAMSEGRTVDVDEVRGVLAGTPAD